MSAAEYRVILDRLGLDTATAARIPGISAADSKRWAAGTLAIPEDVARAFRSWVRSGATPADVQEALDGE